MVRPTTKQDTGMRTCFIFRRILVIGQYRDRRICVWRFHGERTQRAWVPYRHTGSATDLKGVRFFLSSRPRRLIFQQDNAKLQVAHHALTYLHTEGVQMFP
ncbi:hypothetical protein TNCV_4311311 [Trichonephila clavipes]|nr:hypothetical protein TNCV_4311311 [Trichonephila clavipes]